MNKVQHFDFPVSDEEKSKHFYSHIFDWKIKDFPMGEMTYHMIHASEVDENGRGKEVNSINGGFYKKSGPEDKLAIWVSVKSIDDTIKMAEKHGGKVAMPKAEMGEGMGWGAKIADPDGNEIGLWQEGEKK